MIIIYLRSNIIRQELLHADTAASASISAKGQTDHFKISIIIITVFIKEPYTLEKSCRKWSLTVYIEVERDRDPFV